MERYEFPTKKPTAKVQHLMTWDHMRLDKLLAKFQSLLESNHEEAASVFMEFKDGLSVHILCEEDIIFPLYENRIAFKSEAGPEELEMVSAIRNGHREIKHLLQEIHDSILKGNLRVTGLVDRLCSRLKALEEKEEQILYPWIDDEISEEEREEVARKITHALVNR